jgi:hypothetical protein
VGPTWSTPTPATPASPVVKILNTANYYVEPKATSVAVALLKAQINPSDLTADLSQVYVDTDPRAHPVSSYSYLIISKATISDFTTEKGCTLSEFAERDAPQRRSGAGRQRPSAASGVGSSPGRIRCLG